MKVTDCYTLYRHKRFYSAFPALATLMDGRVALAFRRAPDHRWLFGPAAEEDFNSVDHVHFRSHIAFGLLDNNFTLNNEPQILPVHGEAADQDGNLFVSKSGRLFQYSFRWYPVTKEIVDRLPEIGIAAFDAQHLGAGFILSGAYVRFSDDAGENWSTPFEIPQDPIARPIRCPEIQGTASIRGQMVELANGDILLAVYYGTLAELRHDSVRILRSSDNGVSWQYTSQHLAHKTWALQEPTLAAWPEGEITMFCRTKYNDDRLVTLTSRSDRVAFGEPCSHDVTGHPYSALALPDGRLFLCYGYRHDAMGSRARLVEPGQQIEQAEELVIRDDSRSRDTGYPSATPLSDGRILVSYYIPDDNGIRGIEASIIEVD